MSAIIYLFTNTVNGKQYVGKTTRDINTRWKEHCCCARRGSILKIHLAIQKYGMSAFSKEILEETTLDDVNLKEIYWIEQLHPEYNMTTGGDGTLGWIPSEEWRKKTSSRLLGENHPMYGKKHTDDSKYKIKKALIGRSRSETTKAKISAQKKGEKNAFYGKKHTPETRDKIRQALKLRKIMNRVCAPEVTISIKCKNTK